MVSEKALVTLFIVPLLSCFQETLIAAAASLAGEEQAAPPMRIGGAMLNPAFRYRT